MNNTRKVTDLKFESTWESRDESLYTHWIKSKPQNQIQLAFRNHWEVFNEIMNDPLFNGGRRCLEVGCGRGSLSAYFSDHGYQCSLLDLSETVIGIAKSIFKKNALSGSFYVGDVHELPFEDNSFDLVFSIGLLEHIEDNTKCIREQMRILDDGGLFIAYVVPEYTDNVQKEYNWINHILKGYVNLENTREKEDIYRSNHKSSHYIDIMEKLNVRGIKTSGAYPLPMISHSIEFPFSLMPTRSEEAVVNHFEQILAERRKKSGGHPWFCEESYGQAFLVWGFK